VQFDANDVSDIKRIFDLLGNAEGVDELLRFSKSVPQPIQRDIAVALVAHDQLEYEPLAISLLIDASALGWKRANAASALGEHGTERALPYLRQIASEPATTDDLKQLHIWALSASQRLERRLTQQR
jgi:HEAT repeat protein